MVQPVLRQGYLLSPKQLAFLSVLCHPGGGNAGRGKARMGCSLGLHTLARPRQSSRSQQLDVNKGRQPFYNSRRKEEKTAPQRAENRHYGLAMRDELFNEPQELLRQEVLWTLQPWKKWPFHLQNVSSLSGCLAGAAAIQGQLLPFLKAEYSPQRS